MGWRKNGKEVVINGLLHLPRVAHSSLPSIFLESCILSAQGRCHHNSFEGHSTFLALTK